MFPFLNAYDFSRKKKYNPQNQIRLKWAFFWAADAFVSNLAEQVKGTNFIYEKKVQELQSMNMYTRPNIALHYANIHCCKINRK